MNYALLIGRLTKDPEVRENVTRFSIAVDRRFKRDGEPTVDFFNCVAFGKTADFVAKYFFKGKQIAFYLKKIPQNTVLARRRHIQRDRAFLSDRS